MNKKFNIIKINNENSLNKSTSSPPPLLIHKFDKNGQNNNNNENFQKKIKLNQMIFNDIIPYLIYKKQFKPILEFSLISKQSFKIIQNLITHQQRQLRIILGDKSSIISYIENTNNDDQYSNKLIQFRSMEYLSCRDNDSELDSLKCKYLGMGAYVKFKTNWRVYSKTNSIQFKEFMIKNCPQIKNVNLAIELLSEEYNIDDNGIEAKCYDYSENGFYSFDRLWTEVWENNLPISSDEEYNKIWYNSDPVDVNGTVTSSSNSIINRRLFNYNFQYINLYQPRKFTIIQCDGQLIFNPFNLLKIKSIESLDIQHRTSSKFIIEALKSKTLKSLSIVFISDNTVDNFYPNSNNYYYNGDDDDDDSNKEFCTLTIVESGDEDKESDIYFSIRRKEVIIKKNEFIGKELVKGFQELKSNYTLRKLKINVDQYYYCRDPTPLFELIKSSGNQTLNKLSLPGYRITRSTLLEPLIQIPSITTLYFEASFFFQYNSKSFNAYLRHINENQNIQTFKCLLVYNAAGWNPILKKLETYFFENKNRPITICLTFSISFDCFTTDHNCEEIKFQLNKKLKESGNDNIIKLLFKYKVGKKEY